VVEYYAGILRKSADPDARLIVWLREICEEDETVDTDARIDDILALVNAYKYAIRPTILERRSINENH